MSRQYRKKKRHRPPKKRETAAETTCVMGCPATGHVGACILAPKQYDVGEGAAIGAALGL
jgi:hypothetical protein